MRSPALLRLDDEPIATKRELGEQKLADVHAGLADLRRIESLLKILVNSCQASHGTASCPLISSLQQQ